MNSPLWSRSLIASLSVPMFVGWVELWYAVAEDWFDQGVTGNLVLAIWATMVINIAMVLAAMYGKSRTIQIAITFLTLMAAGGFGWLYTRYSWDENELVGAVIIPVIAALAATVTGVFQILRRPIRRNQA